MPHKSTVLIACSGGLFGAVTVRFGRVQQPRAMLFPLADAEFSNFWLRNLFTELLSERRSSRSTALVFVELLVWFLVPVTLADLEKNSLQLFGRCWVFNSGIANLY